MENDTPHCLMRSSRLRRLLSVRPPVAIYMPCGQGCPLAKSISQEDVANPKEEVGVHRGQG